MNMRTLCYCLIAFLILATSHVQVFAQQRISVRSIEDSLKTINKITARTSGMLLSYRGLSRFLGTKVASYLSDGGDLSLFKNYAVLNTEDGRLSVNHNFAFTDPDNGRTYGLLTGGLRLNVRDAFTSVIKDSEFSDDIGINLKYTYIGRGLTRYDSDRQRESFKTPENEDGPQKKRFNRERAKILTELNFKMEDEADDFEKELREIDSKDLSIGDTLDMARDSMRTAFYQELRTRYLKLFTEREAKYLENKNAKNLVFDWWISGSVYVPLTRTTYSIANNFSTNFSDEKTYPFEAVLSINGILESRRLGRFFLYLNGGFIKNNSAKTEEVIKVDLNSYRNLGGTDTLSYALLTTKKAYVGAYSEFFTPKLKAQVVYFPLDWIVGISLLAEQHFGKYNPLNTKLGFPIKLKGKEDDKFVNFELQIRTTDISGKIEPDKSVSKKTIYGISVGLPFSSFVN